MYYIGLDMMFAASDEGVRPFHFLYIYIYMYYRGIVEAHYMISHFWKTILKDCSSVVLMLVTCTIIVNVCPKLFGITDALATPV